MSTSRRSLGRGHWGQRRRCRWFPVHRALVASSAPECAFCRHFSYPWAWCLNIAAAGDIEVRSPRMYLLCNVDVRQKL